MAGEYEGVRRVRIEPIDAWDELDGATFVPVCSRCGRFVKVRKAIGFSGPTPTGPNADCSRCGPTTMLFEGYF
jgi:hypothetical protein